MIRNMKNRKLLVFVLIPILLTVLFITPPAQAKPPTQFIANSSGVAIGDYDNDGLNDLAFSDGIADYVEVYASDGTMIEQWTGLSDPVGVAIGDYDNDGLNDLAFTENMGNTVTVYASDGTMIEQWTGLSNPWGVAIGDYDNDGLNDLAFSSGMADYVVVYASDGTTILEQWTGLSYPVGVAIGDYDNDGLNDLAFAEIDADTVTVYASDGTMIEQWTGLSNPIDVAIGDYDNDGVNDLAYTEFPDYITGSVTVLYGLETVWSKLGQIQAGIETVLANVGEIMTTLGQVQTEVNSIEGKLDDETRLVDDAELAELKTQLEDKLDEMSMRVDVQIEPYDSGSYYLLVKLNGVPTDYDTLTVYINDSAMTMGTDYQVTKILDGVFDLEFEKIKVKGIGSLLVKAEITTPSGPAVGSAICTYS